MKKICALMLSFVMIMVLSVSASAVAVPSHPDRPDCPDFRPKTYVEVKRDPEGAVVVYVAVKQPIRNGNVIFMSMSKNAIEYCPDGLRYNGKTLIKLGLNTPYGNPEYKIKNEMEGMIPCRYPGPVMIEPAYG